MSAVVVESLSKRYRLRHQQQVPYRTLRDAIAGVATAPARWLRGGGGAVAVDDFWALRDVSFEVGRGEVIGIIGRNGAGKSTLLKILSRITEPTSGRAEIEGRVASLLEVGTGFHPELTGRENIFLNGAILGMTGADIRRQFDSIVAFAEIERFLDTPVKRYSSGMYVRLAFSVAAHLEPEVLIVDEVLAVGDLAFQQKSIGKMHEVSRGGRTVLFVSHNMAAINSLTTRALLLDGGQIAFDGPTRAAVGRYSDVSLRAAGRASYGRGTHTAIASVQLEDAAGAPTAQYVPGEPLRIAVSFETDGAPRLSLELFLTDSMQQKLAMASTYQFDGAALPDRPGRYRTVLELHPIWLAAGAYTLDVTTSVVNSSWDHYVTAASRFDVVGCNPGGLAWNFKHEYGYGALALSSVRKPRFDAEPDAV
jgi:lipopolysaccharide transport system ATP-binding protein